MKCSTCGIEGHDSQGNKELCLVALVARCKRVELQVGEVKEIVLKRNAELTDALNARDTAERLNGEYRTALEKILRLKEATPRAALDAVWIAKDALLGTNHME